MDSHAGRMFRAFTAVVAVPLLLGSLGCGSERPKRIVILTNAVSPFWDAADVGAKNAARDLNVADAKLQVVFDRNTKGTEGQIAKLRQYAGAGDIVGLAISVTDPDNAALISEMRRLQEKGVHVITIDSDVDRTTSRDARFAYIGTDNIVGGRELGRCAKGLCPEGGKYATFVGYKGQGNAIERNDGFDEGAGSAFTRVENLGDEVDESKARRNVRDAFNRNRDIRVYVGIWSYNTPAIVDVVRELGIRGEVAVVGFDAEPLAISQMAEGHIDALVVQNPYEMGYQGVKLLKALVEGDRATIDQMFPQLESDPEQGDIYDTGLKVIVPDSSSPLAPDLFEPRTEFLMLGDFQAWLDQYGLIGS